MTRTAGGWQPPTSRSWTRRRCGPPCMSNPATCRSAPGHGWSTPSSTPRRWLLRARGGGVAAGRHRDPRPRPRTVRHRRGTRRRNDLPGRGRPSGPGRRAQLEDDRLGVGRRVRPPCPADDVASWGAGLRVSFVCGFPAGRRTPPPPDDGTHRLRRAHRTTSGRTGINDDHREGRPESAGCNRPRPGRGQDRQDRPGLLRRRHRPPKWVTVHTGLFGTGESFVPLQGAQVQGGSSPSATTSRRSRTRPTSTMTATCPRRRSSSSTATTASVATTTDPAALMCGTGGWTRPTPGPRRGRDVADDREDRDVRGRGRTRGRGTSGPVADTAMTRSQEQLRVGTETREAGRARLRKHVVTEQQSVTVPVSVSRSPSSESRSRRRIGAPPAPARRSPRRSTRSPSERSGPWWRRRPCRSNAFGSAPRPARSTRPSAVRSARSRSRSTPTTVPGVTVVTGSSSGSQVWRGGGA